MTLQIREFAICSNEGEVKRKQFRSGGKSQLSAVRDAAMKSGNSQTKTSLLWVEQRTKTINQWQAALEGDGGGGREGK